MRSVRGPNLRQFAGAEQPGKLLGIPAVCFDPIAGLAWNQGWGNHSTFVAKRLNLSLQPISRRAGLIAKSQSQTRPHELADQPSYRRAVRGYFSQIANLSVAATLGNRNGMPIFGNVQAYENLVIIFHGSSSWREDRLLEQPSFQRRQCRANHLTAGIQKGHTVLLAARTRQTLLTSHEEWLRALKALVEAR